MASANGTSEQDTSWEDGVRVDERRLQAYLHHKQHTLLLKGAVEVMRHTLDPMPTSNAEDGFVHFGDSLMLWNSMTQGLLQADIVQQAHVEDGSKSDPSGPSTSTSKIFTACPRNVFTISRVNDGDEFGNSAFVHYGQVVRLATSVLLHERPLYLFSSTSPASGAEGAQAAISAETLVCLYPRALAASKWRILTPTGETADAGCHQVRLNSGIRLESVVTGCTLSSDLQLRMNHYGNEWRTFGALPSTASLDLADKTTNQAIWRFVNSQCIEGMIHEAQSAAACEPVDSTALAQRDADIDPARLLRDPVYRADNELRSMERQGAAAFAVLERVFPLLRRAGMLTVRRLRRMCINADVSLAGVLPLRTFSGILSYVGIRLKREEHDFLLELFGKLPPPGAPTLDDEGNKFVDYRRFFAMMEPDFPAIREEIVRDAYARLQENSIAGCVTLSDIQTLWHPRGHPEVQQGRLSTEEAREEFFREWHVISADAVVSYEEFHEFYKDMSMAVESDQLFLEMVRSSWNL